MDISIKDFQAVDSADVEVDGFTVIVGPSNVGKSSLVRAMDSAITNNPPMGYVRKGAPHSEVTINMDGDSFTWKKGRGVSEYTVNGTVYQKTGKQVPDDVSAFGLRKVLTGNTELRVQVAPQHDPFFLVNKTGHVVADAVSGMSEVHVINGAIRSATADRRGKEIAASTDRDNRLRLSQSIEKFNGFDDLEHLAKRANMVAVGTDKGPGLIQLSKDLEEVEGWQRRLAILTEGIKRLDVAKSLEVPDLSGIEELAGDLQWVNVAINKLDRLTRDTAVQLDVEFPVIEDLDLGVVQYLCDASDEIASLISKCKTMDADLKKLEAAEKAAQKSLERIMSEVNECPVCGSKL